MVRVRRSAYCPRHPFSSLIAVRPAAPSAAGERADQRTVFAGLASRARLCAAARHRSRRSHVGMATPRSRLYRLACAGEYRHPGRSSRTACMGASLSPNIRAALRQRPGSSGMPNLIPGRSPLPPSLLIRQIPTASILPISRPGSPSPSVGRDANMPSSPTAGIISGSTSRKGAWRDSKPSCSISDCRASYRRSGDCCPWAGFSTYVARAVSPARSSRQIPGSPAWSTCCGSMMRSCKGPASARSARPCSVNTVWRWIGRHRPILYDHGSGVWFEMRASWHAVAGGN